MKKTTLLLIGALALVLQSATALTILYSDDFEGQTLGGPPHAGSPPYAAMSVYMFGGTVTAWDVEEALDPRFNITQAAVLDWTVNSGCFGFGFSMSSQTSLAAGGGSLGDLTFSFDVYTEGAAIAGATTPLTIWFDQFPGGVKTFDASISPTIITDGLWTHVSFTLDQLTPSGMPGSTTYDPTQGFEIAFDGGMGCSLNAGDTGQIVLDNILLLYRTPGAPTLNITHSGNSVTVSWPTTDGFTLQQGSDLSITATNWTTSSYSVSTNNGTSSITITPPAGHLYFRLCKP